jgi:uncharacterized lipoprotein YmbA
MKTPSYSLRLILMALASLFLTGCLLRTATVPPRHFVLAAIPAEEISSSSHSNLSVEIGFVKMPAYLLRDSVAVRTGPNEIEYLQNALWAERLDQCLERTLTVNLRRLRSSNGMDLANLPRDQGAVKVLINVEQFEVDIRGQGVLIARWRIIAPDGNKLLNVGHTRLVRTAAAPRGQPEVIATTLSDLAAQLSRDIAQSVRESRSS